MTSLGFAFEKHPSAIFGSIYRPVAKVNFWSYKFNQWLEIILIVDTGADYTLLPKFYSVDLGIDLKKDCTAYITHGVGGAEKVYMLKNAKVKLGKWETKIPLGFLDHDNIPPLLGRQRFLEVLKVSFHRHITCFQI